MGNEKSAGWEGIKRSTQSFARSILNSAQKTIQETVDESRERIADAAEDLQKDARKLVKKTNTLVGKKPYPLLGAAFLTGLVLGVLIRRR
jgi:ElaB/YqjD/DUF883 family membrane-anchored ribosome-binding protein